MTWHCAAEGAEKCKGHDDEDAALEHAASLGRMRAVVYECNDTNGDTE